jgi:UDP-N-acetylglucosamine 2-epimerase (non-hydrolysing)
MHLLHVVGARPNFMKAAPVLAALAAHRAEQTLVHTGQQYDVKLSEAMFRDLGLPEPDINLGVGSGSHAEQTAQILVGIERCLVERKPDMLIVYGDLDSTLAATLAAAKMGIPVAHVEAGLRSGDRSMPEEINRLVTDRLASLLFTPSSDANDNLIAEGVDRRSIRLVGNVMIDTLVRLLPRADPSVLLKTLGLMTILGPRSYVLVTLHRPSNVDDDAMLTDLLRALTDIAQTVPVVFPMHPRTRARVRPEQLGSDGLIVTEPMTYLEFLGFQRHASVVITDSGGIQEETTFLGVPCLTMRKTTERPVTVTLGTNELLGRDTEKLKRRTREILAGRKKKGVVPPLWDGKAAGRIAEQILARAQ